MSLSDKLRDRVLDWLFPPVAAIPASAAPVMACPVCAAVRPADELRAKLLDWLFPADVKLINVPSTPAIACPSCAAVHPDLPIPSNSLHSTVLCTCGASFDVFPRAGWRTTLRHP